MGTGGWLVSGYNMFGNDFKDRLNVSGGEVEPETFQYSLMNIILTLHNFPDDIQCNSSLTHVNKNKHNLILTNPPFNSKKQIKFEQIEKSHILTFHFLYGKKYVSLSQLFHSL